jgi:four helix bundle protein
MSPNLVAHQTNFTVMKTYSFENLDVWQCSRRLSVLIYTSTKAFPDDEKFGLVSQMRRAAISVSSNLAEGSAKRTGKEKARFTETAYCSLMELLNQAIISNDLEFLNNDTYLKIRTSIDEIAAKATRLREAQLTLK